MNTRLVNTAAGVILRALTQNRTAAGIALALESAQLLQSPETVAEMERLRAQSSEAYPGELVMLRGLVATLRVVAVHGDLADVVKLLDEHQRDEQDAFAEMGGA
ncbi:hypothetical protein ACPCJT_20385 [Streptomyces griseoincarnatus]